MLEVNNINQVECDYEEAEKKLKSETVNLEKGIKLKTIINEDEVNLDTKKLIDELKILVSNITREFMERFDVLLEECMKEKEGITEKIFQYIKDKELDKPEFIISEGECAQKILDDFGLEYVFYKGDVLLALQLPKQLAEYWWKGRENFQFNLNKSEDKEIIKWGYFYKELMPKIWEQVELFEYRHGVTLNRINMIAQHDPKKYYYVWQAKKKKQMSREKLEVVEYSH